MSTARATAEPAYAQYDGYKVRISRRDRVRFEKVRGRLTSAETISMLLDCWDDATATQRKHYFAKAVSK